MCVPKRGLRPLRKCKGLPALLEEHGLKTGVEVGIQEGKFAEYVLKNWKSCKSWWISGRMRRITTTLQMLQIQHIINTTKRP